MNVSPVVGVGRGVGVITGVGVAVASDDALPVGRGVPDWPAEAVATVDGVGLLPGSRLTTKLGFTR